MQTSRIRFALLLLLLTLAAGSLSAGLNRWTFFGPSGTFSHIRALSVVVPGPSATLLVSTEAGVFRSEDAGRTWTWSGDGLGRAEIRDFFPAPSDPSVIYADAFGALFRSTDGGRHWELVYVLQSSLESFAVDPAAPTLIYMADGPNLLKSLDGGETWRRIFTGTTVIAHIVIDPRDLDTIYISNLSDAFKSTDAGETWTEIEPVISPFPTSARIQAFVVAPSDPDVLYVSSEVGFFRSTDGGETWTQVTSGISFNILFVDPRDPMVLYGAVRDGTTVSVSRDGGETWRDVGNGRPPGVTLSALAFDPVTRVLYAGTEEQGVMRIVRAGRQWQAIAPQTGSPADYVIWMKFHPADPSRIYALADIPNPRLLESRDGGRTWRRIAEELPGVTELIFDPRDRQTLYVSHGGEIWRSTDGGADWTRLRTYPSASTLAFPDRRTIVAGGCGIQRSADGGRTWTAVLVCTVGDPDFEGFSRQVDELRVDPFDPSTIYARVTEIGGRHPVRMEPQIYVSRDAGRTWTLSLALGDLLVTPDDRRGTLYAFTAGGSIRKSTDAGRTWQILNTSDQLPVPWWSVTDLEVDQENPETLYLSSSEGGVFRSTDEGRTWTPLNAGLARRGWTNIHALVMHPTVPHLLYALPRTGIMEGLFPLP